MPRQTQNDKINKLDKDVALIAQEVKLIKDNHLVHLDQKISNINKILIAVTFFIITELLILVRMLMMG